MAYFLAVDAGGTKSDFLLADERHELARARVGSVKRLRVNEETASENLRSALAALRERSGIDPQQVAATCIGAAGSNVPLVADWLREAFAKHVGGKVLLLEDVEIALDSAFHGGPGVLVLAGTGSNVAGRARDGYLTAAGGWGPALADYGSGYNLGQTALRACFRALDDGEHTEMLQGILDLWHLQNIPALVELANADPRPDMSQLAALVGRCALDGDAVATRVVEEEAAALCHLVDVVVGRLRQRDTNHNWTPNVAFTGSIMEHLPAMRQTVERILQAAYPGVTLHAGVADPVQGALWRARRG